MRWQMESDDPNRLPDVTETTVHAVETQLGVRLPPDYLAMLGIQNGGFITPRELPIVRDGQADIVVVDAIVGIDRTGGLVEFQTLLPEWGIEDERLIAFAGDGHFFLAFDSRDGAPPRIVYIDSDTGRVEPLFDSFFQLTEAFVTLDVTAMTVPSNGPDTTRLDDESLIEFGKRLLYSANPEEKIEGAILWHNELMDEMDMNDVVLELMTWLGRDGLHETAISLICIVIEQRKPLDPTLQDAFFKELLRYDDVYSQEMYASTRYVLDHDLRVE